MTGRSLIAGLVAAGLACLSACGPTNRGARFAGGGAFTGADPVMTPDLQRVVLASPREGLGDIYIMRVDGTDLQRLTSAPEYDGEASLSSDGSRIAFVSEREGSGDIYVMNIDGSELTRVTDSAAYEAHPAFSPDGASIVFDRNDRIFMINSDGSGERPLTQEGLKVMHGWPSFSPDGRSIVYQVTEYDSVSRGVKDSAWIMEADGSNPRLLQERAISPAFSPDGRTIVFLSDRHEPMDWEIYLMDLEGSVTQLTFRGGMKDAPSFTPDGTRVIFNSEGPGGRSGSVQIVDIDGSNLETIARIY